MKKGNEKNCNSLSFSMDETSKNSEIQVDGLFREGILTTKERRINKVKKIFDRYFIKAFTGMAHGLFVTLIAGTIIKQIGHLFPAGNAFGQLLIIIGNLATILMGAGIGAGIALKLQKNRLVVFATMVAGLIGAYSTQLLKLDYATMVNLFKIPSPGNPIGAYIVSLVAIEWSKFIAGKTKLDILITPLLIFVLAIIGAYIAIPFIRVIDCIAKGITIATKAAPFVMGVVISVVMGILLTMPTSSAAIWIAIALPHQDSDIMLLAGGAAVVGCAAHMIGFAVISFKDNGISGLISQGIGTSMLQIPNIMRHPIILIPPVVASAIVGPLSTCVFKLKCDAIGGGMGTSGFVGVISVIKVADMPEWKLALSIIMLMFVLPALISYITYLILKKFKLIKDGYLSLNYID